jgi:hypothetical protein
MTKYVIGYSDFVRLCRVDNPENWNPGVSIRSDGVYVVPLPSDANLTPEERSTLSWHPTGNLNEPALPFPCSLDDLRAFLESAGLYGCIDAFDMADWILSKTQEARNNALLPASRAHVSEKLAFLNQAAMKFWANADPDDRGTHPDNATVAAWLEKQGFSQTLADKAATIIRPEWASTGRKPEE